MRIHLPARRAFIALLAIVALTGAACSAEADDGGTAPIADLPLTARGIGNVTFGAHPDDVLDALQPILGGPSTDTDWLDEGSGIYGECPTPLRVISWGSLSTFHSGGQDTREFFAYSYGFDFEEALAGVDSRELNLTTSDGIGVGSTVAALRDLDASVVLDGDEVIDVWTFAIDGDSNPYLLGQVTGIDDTDTVLFIETSTGCR